MTSISQILTPSPKTIIAVLATLLLIPNSVFASNRVTKEGLPWYEIEVIIFANTDQKGLDTETWPSNPPMKAFSQVVTLDFAQGGVPRADLPDFAKVDYQTARANALPTKVPEPFVFLNASEFRLGAAMSKLRANAKFEPLLHIAWRQPTLSPKAAPPVFVYSGMNAPGANTGLINTGQQFVGPQSVKLYGLIRLSVSRYLHVETDLHLRSPVVQQQYVLEPPSGGFFSGSEPVEKLVQRNVLMDFRMHESRRMRSKEIHFFDHPMFGVIVLVTPYEFSGI